MSLRDEVIWVSSNPKRAVDVSISVVNAALERKLSKPPCAVFDVDETLLQHHPSLDNHFKIHRAGRQLFDTMAAKNIPIFIVTARRKGRWALKFLTAQLKYLGYDTSKISGYYFVPKEYDEVGDYGASYKRVARERIGKDYAIVLNAGDRWGDVVRDHDNLSDSGTVAEKVVHENKYVGCTSAEPHVLHSVKFPRP